MPAESPKSPPQPIPPQPPGAELAEGYLCVDLLQRGDVFDVYDAWSVQRHCRCVVKLVRPEVTSPRIRQRLLREGRLLTRLDHPNLLRGYEVRVEPAMVVSRAVCGLTVEGFLLEGGRFAADHLAALAVQLAAALRFLHACGYLHLDLKPANVMLDSGLPVLIDFSLVQRPGRIRAGTGSPRYMAPEQARGGAVDTAADVWGLGITLFEAATGRSPFAEAWEELSAYGCPTCQPEGRVGPAPQLPQLRLRAPGVRRWRRGLSAELSGLINACLEPDPADRPGLEDVSKLTEQLTGYGPPRPLDQPK